MARVAGVDDEVRRFTTEPSYRLHGRPPPDALMLDCNDRSCIVCQRGDGLEVATLDLSTGELGSASSFPTLDQCAIGQDGRIVASGMFSVPMQLDGRGITPILTEHRIQSARPVVDGRLLVNGQRTAGAWYVGWLDGDRLTVLAESESWLGEPRASDDGQATSWLVTRQSPAAWDLVRR